MKKVLILEDELLIAEEIKIICEQNGFIVKSIFNNFHDAIEYFCDNEIDIIITDVFIKGEKTGLDFIHAISNLKIIPIIVITAFSSKIVISDIVQYHNVSYITKPYTTEQLVSVIKIASLRTFNSNNCYNLSAREHQIIAFLIKGKSNEEIASDLFLSPQTVKTHRKNIFLKLNVSNIIQLINLVTCKGN